MARDALPALLLLLAVGAGAGADELDRVCGSLGGYYVTPGACLSALCSDASDPCRAARDAPAVAALAARLAARDAAAARSALQSAGNATSAARSSCLRLYGGAVPALRWAAASVAAGRYRGAREVLQAAQYAAAGCEGVMSAGDDDEDAAPPPENGRFSDAAFVAHAVVAYMVSD